MKNKPLIKTFSNNYLNQLDVNKDIINESDDIIQDDEDDFFNQNQPKINMNFNNSHNNINGNQQRGNFFAI